MKNDFLRVFSCATLLVLLGCEGRGPFAVSVGVVDGDGAASGSSSHSTVSSTGVSGAGGGLGGAGGGLGGAGGGLGGAGGVGLPSPVECEIGADGLAVSWMIPLSDAGLHVNAADVDAAGDIYLTGLGGFVAKYGSGGEPRWIIGGISEWADKADRIAVGPDGLVATYGLCQDVACVRVYATTDTSVALLLQITDFGFFATDVAISPTGHILVTGAEPHGTKNCGVIAAYDTLGVLQWEMVDVQPYTIGLPLRIRVGPFGHIIHVGNVPTSEWELTPGVGRIEEGVGNLWYTLQDQKELQFRQFAVNAAGSTFGMDITWYGTLATTRISPGGQLLWSVDVLYESSGYEEFMCGIAPMPSGDIWTCAGSGYGYTFLSHLTGAGELVEQRAISLCGTASPYLNSIHAAKGGGLYVLGADRLYALAPLP